MMPRQSLVQVLINLVINAIQAMAEADERKLTISGQARGDRAIIDLIDTGCGIPVADQARIFLPFFSTRGSRPSGTTNADTGVSGLGLGLTVVTQLLEHHRGSIRVHSKPGRGSCFRLSLPLAHRATAPSSDSSGTYRKDLSGLRVLIVDDEPSIREIVATMVEEFGGQATAVPDGRTALDRLHDHTFEAVIVDWSMPVMGGREFLDRLHQERPGPLSHVLVASGLIHDEEIRHIRQLGVQNILSKPIHQKHLLTALRRLRRARPA
jgi:CheY-like chemotaxis protein